MVKEFLHWWFGMCFWEYVNEDERKCTICPRWQKRVCHGAILGRWYDVIPSHQEML